MLSAVSRPRTELSKSSSITGGERCIYFTYSFQTGSGACTTSNSKVSGGFVPRVEATGT